MKLSKKYLKESLQLINFVDPGRNPWAIKYNIYGNRKEKSS